MKFTISRDLEKHSTTCVLTIFDSDLPPGVLPWDPVAEVRKKEKPVDRLKRFIELVEEIME